MSTLSPTSRDSASPINADGIKFALRMMSNSKKRLTLHKEFLDSGGAIRWVIDADVFRLFLAPKDNVNYADLFRILTVNKLPSKSLEALSYLLGDFIFSKRFNISDQALC
jgi:hypothetical protein